MAHVPPVRHSTPLPPLLLPSSSLSLPPGREADTDHLYWLQSYSLGGSLQRNALSLQKLQRALPPATGDAPPLCFVAEIGGAPAAALLLQPAEEAPAAAAAPEPQQGRVLQVLLAAAFPGLDQCAEVMGALLSYALCQLVADGATAALQQGNLLLLPGMQLLAPVAVELPASEAVDAPVLTIAASEFTEDDSAGSGGSGEGTDAEPEQRQEQPTAAWQQHSVCFEPGASLDGLASCVAAYLYELSDTHQPFLDAQGPTDDASAPPPEDADAVAAVLRTARRISRQWQAAAAPAATGAAAEAAAAADVFADVSAVVQGFLDAAGFDSERALLLVLVGLWPQTARTCCLPSCPPPG